MTRLTKSSASKCLFGPPDHETLSMDLQLFRSELCAGQTNAWNFDFSSCSPLPGRYAWVPVQEHRNQGEVQTAAEEETRRRSSICSTIPNTDQLCRRIGTGETSFKVSGLDFAPRRELASPTGNATIAGTEGATGNVSGTGSFSPADFVHFRMASPSATQSPGVACKRLAIRPTKIQFRSNVSKRKVLGANEITGQCCNVNETSVTI